MNNGRAHVRNAASPRQVGSAERRAKDRRVKERNDLLEVLSTEPGRRVLMRLLEECGVWRSVLSDNVTRMAAAAGQQNVGHYLRERIYEADPLALVTMLREEQVDRERENRETDAVHGTSDQETETHEPN